MSTTKHDIHLKRMAYQIDADASAAVRSIRSLQDRAEFDDLFTAVANSRLIRRDYRDSCE